MRTFGTTLTVLVTTCVSLCFVEGIGLRARSTSSSEPSDDPASSTCRQYFNGSSSGGGVNNSYRILISQLKEVNALIPSQVLPLNASRPEFANWTAYDATEHLYYSMMPRSANSFADAIDNATVAFSAAYALLAPAHENATEAQAFYPKRVPVDTWIATGRYLSDALRLVNQTLHVCADDLTPRGVYDRLLNVTLAAENIQTNWLASKLGGIKRLAHWHSVLSNPNSTRTERHTARQHIALNHRRQEVLNLTATTNYPLVYAIGETYGAAEYPLISLYGVATSSASESVGTVMFNWTKWSESSQGSAETQKIQALKAKIALKTLLGLLSPYLELLCGATP